MPELEILEAKAPARTVQLVKAPEPATVRLAPVAAWLSGPVFSRARDIFAANITEILDRSEDPARMIRMVILEMEDALVEVRATAARAIADIKEMRRALTRLDDLNSDWTEKAELALAKDREDLARGALIERQKAAEMADSLRAEMDQIEAVLRGYEADIAKLQAKLREAHARQNAIAARFESAVNRARAREMTYGARTAEAFSKFELLERRADFAEGRAEALGLSSLEDEIEQLKVDEKIDSELQAMKAARSVHSGRAANREEGE
jgi:phage shock protein A